MPRKAAVKEESFVGRSEELLSADDARNLLGSLMRTTGSVPVGLNRFSGYFRSTTALDDLNITTQQLERWYKAWLGEEKERVREAKATQKKIEDALFEESKTLTVSQLRPEHIAVLKKRKVF